MVKKTLRRLAAAAILLLCALDSLPALAALQAYVDHNPVSQDESLTLTVESSGDVDGAPDWSPLKQDFDLQGQSRNTSLSIINGSMSRKTQWMISLIPKRSGRIQIPSISVGGEQTQPLTVTVTPASQAQAQQPGGDLYMEVSAEPVTPYVQQQIIYTVRLFHAVDLGSGATLSQPDLPDGNAVVEQLGKDKRYQSMRDGMRYDVIERRYAIYPQKSGAVDIAPVEFDGDIVQGGGGNGMFPFGIDPFNQRTVHKRLHSRAVHINVKPIPAAFHGAQWLPARSLQLEQSWSPDPPKFEVGQPVTRTLSVLAGGLTSSQLPALGTGAVNGVKQYPDQPSLKETQTSDGITGLRTEKTAYIPTHAGTVTLPAVRIPWWNTTTDKMEVATLPARTFTVAPASANGSAAPPPAPSAAATSPPSPQPSKAVAAVLTPSAPPARTVPGRWPWIALLLGIGWLATAAAWWRQARHRSTRINPAQREDESLRHLEKVLKDGCHANDAAQAKHAVLAWARCRWAQHPPMSLTAVARRCPGPLGDALVELDRALYAQTASAWQGETLWRQFCAHKPAGIAHKADGRTALAPLYHSG